MLRGLPLGRCTFFLAATALILCAGMAQAANTSRPTGRGAIHDNRVYCQNSPGQPARPEYRGTGSQNPFGGECGPGPAVQPAEPEPEEQAEDSCPMTEASARQTGIVLVADQPADELIDERDYRPGLWIAAGQGQWQEVRDPGQVGLDGLSQDGKKIFETMRCHRTRMFRFTDAQRLKDTIGLREQIVKRMQKLVRIAREAAQGHAPGSGCILFSGGTPQLPSAWQPYREPRATLTTTMMGAPVKTAARSKPGVDAHEAILSLRAEGARVECHWGMQMTVLDAAAAALGEHRFNELHPVRSWPNLPPQIDDRSAEHALVGLGVPLLADEDLIPIQVPGTPITPPLQFGFWTRMVDNASLTSLAKHLFIVRHHLPDGMRNRGSKDPSGDAMAGRIKTEDMVPGDWAYLKNVPDYDAVRPGGPFAGENAFYLDELTRGNPRSRVFYGFGVLPPRLPPPSFLRGPPRFLTGQEIAVQMAEDFNEAPHRPFDAVPDDMVWTRLGGPIIDDRYPMEAGAFVPTTN